MRPQPAPAPGRASARLLAAAALLVGGCAAPPPLADDGLVALGETATFGALTVTPLAVREDSRCPQAVRCVWQGRVRVETRIATATQIVDREVTLGQPLPVAGGALMLARVLPARQPEAAIAAADYRFGFSFAPPP